MTGEMLLKTGQLDIGEKEMSNLSIYDTLNRLKEQWERVPEMRLMQLISNFQSYRGNDCFYMEDENFIINLTEYVDELKGEN